MHQDSSLKGLSHCLLCAAAVNVNNNRKNIDLGVVMCRVDLLE